ncbi:hypothetical protein HAX54_022586, partial [Datura stramonium]|nr:hypothetical protein [Datura stramonium]
MPNTYLSTKSRRDPLIDDAFRRQQAVADKALSLSQVAERPFPKYLGKRKRTARSKDSGKSNSILQVQVDVPDIESE